MNPLRGGSVPVIHAHNHTHTPRQSLGGEVTCPLCKSYGRAEADKHGSVRAACRNVREEETALSYIHIPATHTHEQTQAHARRAVQTVLARACSLSSEPVKPSNQSLPPADSNKQEHPSASCIIHEGAEPSVLFTLSVDAKSPPPSSTQSLPLQTVICPRAK